VFKTHRKVISIVLLALVGSLILTAIALGQAAGFLDLSWSTIAGGGGESAGGRYAVDDSLGQGVASDAPSTDGDRYALTDGFWQTHQTKTTIYLPLVSRNGS
jgi:hypothetical protein